MSNEKKLTEQESLQLITTMIQKAKASYHERGISAILWGTVVAVASLVTYLRREFDFNVPFDPFLLVLAAIIPQIFISIKQGRENKVTKFEDTAINAVWLVYGISIFALIFYQNVVPSATIELCRQDGWQLMIHYLDGSKPDEPLHPFVPSVYSLFLLLYAFPTLVTGIAKKYAPMTVGAIITYILFIASCYTASKYDMLFGTIAALVCWLIPGIILRRKYLKQKSSNV
ncbi:MAG: hypothetical protein KF781_08990 [Chitinophagaceae bacterium]|nr:hypothetical protein [Chitinophagaceae bacterium]MCW5905049.1 hypothetical protein [Chitinophagaceae bacterium]